MPVYPLGIDVAMYELGAALRDIAWVSKQDLYCRDVTCSGGATACRNTSVCEVGECVPGPPINEGDSCDDGILLTQDDICEEGMAVLPFMLQPRRQGPRPVKTIHVAGLPFPRHIPPV